MPRTLTVLGAVAAGLAVFCGAFAAHGLEDLSSEQLEWWETGAQYHMYHALGMLAAAWIVTQAHPRLAAAGGWLFLLGIILFSGSLYGLALSEWVTGETQRWLGAITPFGGISMLLGWAVLAVAAAIRRP